MNIKVKDRDGKVLKAGIRIAYPVRRKSQMDMHISTIKKLEAVEHGQGGLEVVAQVETEGGRTVPFRAFNRCVALT